MALFEFKLPELGEGIHEGEILKWLVKPGDQVKEDDVIAEVQNDKAVVELPSPVDGTVKEIKVEEGSVAVVGDPLILFETEGAGNVAVKDENSEVGDVTPDRKKDEDHEDLAPKETKPHQVTVKTGGQVLATPATRKLARQLGVDLTQVPGTGRNGQVTREDVQKFAEQPHQDAKQQQQEQPARAKTDRTTTAAAGEKTPLNITDNPEEREPLKGIRRIISEAMVRSKYTAPHVTIMDEVEVTKLVALRERAKTGAEQRGIKVTYLPFIIKALIATLRRYPILNASLDDEKGEIVYKKYYNVGIATDTDNGLLVPVITEADRKNVWTLAEEIRDLATRAREGKLAPHEMKGSTISITNIGSAGGLFFTPIINYPEVAILGTGRITQKPVAKNGEVVIAPVMALSLSFDHRVIDGATAQYFLNDLKELLEDPQLLVMEV